MNSQQLTAGRTFGIRFDPGETFFPALEEFCASHRIRYGYIPMFLAAFAEAEAVGACDKVEDPAAPVWSPVYLPTPKRLAAAPSPTTRMPASVRSDRGEAVGRVGLTGIAWDGGRSRAAGVPSSSPGEPEKRTGEIPVEIEIPA